MLRPLVALTLVGGFGCRTPRGPSCEVDGSHLLIASTDYQSGVLGAVSLDGSCLAEPLASSGTDPLVRTLPDHLLYADRTGGDGVRLYEPGSYDRPLREFALPAGGNTHDVVQVGQELYFARYESSALWVTDLDGRPRRTIELGDGRPDPDGVPEVDRFVVVDDRVFVALQHVDRSTGRPVANGLGELVEVDTHAVLDRIEVGPNPRVWPARDGVFVASGMFFALDGTVEHVTPDGVRTELATEAALGFDVTMVLDAPDGPVFVGLDPDEREPSHLVCGDEHVRFEDWAVDAVTDTEGTTYGISRPLDWAGLGAASAWTLDARECALRELASGFLLGPSSLARSPEGR